MKIYLDNCCYNRPYDDQSQLRISLETQVKSGVKTKDVYHVACAIYANCDYFFTTDDRLLKYATDEIQIVNPIDFIKESEG